MFFVVVVVVVVVVFVVVVVEVLFLISWLKTHPSVLKFKKNKSNKIDNKNRIIKKIIIKKRIIKERIIKERIIKEIIIKEILIRLNEMNRNNERMIIKLMISSSSSMTGGPHEVDLNEVTNNHNHPTSQPLQCMVVCFLFGVFDHLQPLQTII